MTFFACLAKPSRIIALATALGILCALPLQAQDLAAQRARIGAALAQAERGQFDATRDRDLAAHPLYPWLELADLRRRVDTLPARQGLDFLRRHEGQAVATALRAAWLPALSRRQDWPTFLAAWRPTSNLILRCARLNALQATGKADAQWTADAQAIWRSSGSSLPDTCEPVFTILATRGGMPAQLRWERLELAAAAGEPAVMRSIARAMGSDTTLANDYAAFIDAVHTRALSWPRTPLSRRIAMHGLARLAKTDPDAAERQLPQYAQALGMTAAEQGTVQYQIALWTVASYLPGAARRLNAVPASAFDSNLHEWRVRDAIARSDWGAGLAAIRAMPAAQREDSRWRYFEARLAEESGDPAESRRLLQLAARAPTFHGFLAADRLQQPYALCPLDAGGNAQARAAVARDPALVRAIELWNLQRVGWATSEWNNAMERFDDAQRRIAIGIAGEHQWFDRAVFSLGDNPDHTRLYTLRFPLYHDATIRREAARHGVDPAWVAAEIRAESIFNPRARSGANAMGLMQVLPATGAATARALGMPWRGADSLYDPDTNIAIGTAYLRQMKDKFGLPYVAIAAYNAGPTPTARWQSQRPGLAPDFWIETISFRETREYVARVLAFSVIYDWRLDGDAVPVSERMLGRDGAKRKQFACPAGVTTAGS